MERKKCVNKHLFALDFKSNTLSLVLFSLIVSVLMFGTMALFPSMKDLLKDVSDDLREYLTFDSITTFFSSQAMSLWLLLGGIYAVWLGAKLSNGDLKKGNAELLYSLNMSRSEIIRTKALVLGTHITIYNVVVALFSFAGVWIFGGKAYVLGMLCYLLLAWLLCLIVAFSAFCWGFIAKRKFNQIIGWVVLLILYVCTSLFGIVPWLGYLSPFTVFSGDMLANGFGGVVGYGIPLIAWGVLSVLNLVVAVVSFKKADID